MEKGNAVLNQSEYSPIEIAKIAELLSIFIKIDQKGKKICKNKAKTK
jgi:hypothetical protein